MLRHTAVLRLLHAGVEATVIAVWQPVEQSPEIWPAVPVTARAEQRNPRVGGGGTMARRAIPIDRMPSASRTLR